MEGVTAEVAELKGERQKEEEEREAEESMMSDALEARAVLDDMVSAIDHSHQQQQLDHLRQHLNDQLIRVEERLQQCEAALSTRPLPMPQPSLEPHRGEELQQVRAAVTALQQAMMQQLEKAQTQQQGQVEREVEWKEQMQALLRAEVVREAKEAAASAKELLASIHGRVAALEGRGVDQGRVSAGDEQAASAAADGGGGAAVADGRGVGRTAGGAAQGTAVVVAAVRTRRGRDRGCAAR